MLVNGSSLGLGLFDAKDDSAVEKKHTGSQTGADLKLPRWWKIPKISWVSHVSASRLMGAGQITEAFIACQPQKVSVPSTRGEIPWLHRLSLRYSKVEYLRYELPALERSAQATGKETSQIYGFGPDRHPHVTISGEQWLKEYLFSWRWDNRVS